MEIPGVRTPAEVVSVSKDGTLQLKSGILKMKASAPMRAAATAARMRMSPRPIRTSLLCKDQLNPSARPTHRTAKATTQAMAHWLRATRAAAFALPISRLTAAMAATQGV